MPTLKIFGNLGTDSHGLESEICTKNFMPELPLSLKNPTIYCFFFILFFYPVLCTKSRVPLLYLLELLVLVFASSNVNNNLFVVFLCVYRGFRKPGSFWLTFMDYGFDHLKYLVFTLYIRFLLGII